MSRSDIALKNLRQAIFKMRASLLLDGDAVGAVQVVHAFDELDAIMKTGARPTEWSPARIVSCAELEDEGDRATREDAE